MVGLPESLAASARDKPGRLALNQVRIGRRKVTLRVGKSAVGVHVGVFGGAVSLQAKWEETARQSRVSA